MNVKQVIVMRNDLGMRKGKMIAQGAHASMAFLTNKVGGVMIGVNKFSEEEAIWINGIFTKICVRVDSENELHEIVKAAEEAGLTVSLIKDAGLTEFKEPTYTCCAIGPNKSEDIDKITGHLKLL